MATNSKNFDVFIAYDHRDKDIAASVAQVLQSYGLEVFFDAESLGFGAAIEDAIWQAMAESHALVVVVSDEIPSSLLAFEVGAARAWNKPVYAVLAVSNVTHPSKAFQSMPVFPLSRVEEIASSIISSKEPFSAEDRDILGESYKKIGIAVDSLARQPQHLSKLVDDFNMRSGKQMSGEQVMSLLLRHRKRGDLPPLQTRN